MDALGAIPKYLGFCKMAVQQTRTRAGRAMNYQYIVKNHDTHMGENICGIELYYDDMYHPDESNYDGFECMAPDLSSGVKGKMGRYHLSCLCKKHSQMFDKDFIKKQEIC